MSLTCFLSALLLSLPSFLPGQTKNVSPLSSDYDDGYFYVFLEDDGEVMSNSYKIFLKLYTHEDDMGVSSLEDPGLGYYRLRIEEYDKWDYFTIGVYSNDLQEASIEEESLFSTDEMGFGDGNGFVLTGTGDYYIYGYSYSVNADTLYFLNPGAELQDTYVEFYKYDEVVATFEELPFLGPRNDEYYYEIFLVDYFDYFIFYQDNGQTDDVTYPENGGTVLKLSSLDRYDDPHWVAMPDIVKVNYFDVGGSPFSGYAYHKLKTEFKIGITYYLPKPMRAESLFIAWYLDRDGLGEEVEMVDTSDGIDINLYAKWSTEHIEITFDSTGSDDGETFVDTCFKDAPYRLPNSPFLKEGNAFLGWDDKPNSLVAKYGENENVRFGEELTLYPVFCPYMDEHVSVSLDFNDIIDPSGLNVFVELPIDDDEAPLSDSGTCSFYELKEDDDGIYRCFVPARGLFKAGDFNVRASFLYGDFDDDMFDWDHLYCENPYPNCTFDEKLDYLFTVIDEGVVENEFTGIADDLIFKKEGETKLSLSSMRLWMEPDLWWEEDTYRIGLIEKDDIDVCYIATKVETDEGTPIFYVDIPVTVASFYIAKVSAGGDVILKTSGNETDDGVELSFVHSAKLLSILDEGDGTLSINENSVAAEFGSLVGLQAVAKCIEGYCTCLPSERNGYLASDEIESEWLSGFSSSELADLSDYDVSDFTSDGKEKAENAVDALTKFNAMRNLNESSKGLKAKAESALNGTEVISVTVLVLLSALMFYLFVFFRKKLRRRVNNID